MSDPQNYAIGFDNCFICGNKLKTTYWYHDDCYESRPDISRAILALDNIPRCIPQDQQERYIKRIYLGK